MEDFAKRLKRQYSKVIPNSATKWPPLEVSQWKFVDLHLLDKRENVHIDLVVEEGLDRLFNLGTDGGKRVLIEGAPGVGKSTLAYKIAKEWAKGKAFIGYQYVILILLCKSKVHSLKDLIKNPDVYQYLTENYFKNTLFILDGYDELPSHLQSKSIFYDLIAEDILSECELADIIVTSCPYAVRNFTNVNIVFPHHFEILGLTDVSIKSYIDNSLSGDDGGKQSELHDALTKTPQTQSLLYVPLNLVCLVELFKKQGLPDTLTSLYSSLVSTLVLRHLKENKIQSDFKSRNFLSLPEKEKIEFLNICQQAYGQLINSESSKAEITATFGLLIKKPQVMIDSDYHIELTFQHNSIQYFLAAYFISLKSDEIASHFETMFDQKYFQVLLFMSGLKSPSHIMLQSYFDFLSLEEKLEDSVAKKVTFHSLSFFHILFEAKMESSMTKFLAHEDLVIIERTIGLPSPHDLYVLGRCISYSNCKWELGFTRRHLMHEHISMFQQGLNSTNTTNGHIDVACLGYNPIGNKSLEVLHTCPTPEVQYLQQLDIRGASLNSDACNILARYLHEFINLETLLLDDNSIEYGKHMPLVDAMKQSSIKTVSLAKLTSDECTKLLLQNKLEKVKLWQMSGHDLKATLQRICSCKISIKRLKIRCSKINDRHIEELPAALQAMKELSSLSFVNCGITSSTTFIIAEAVAYHPTIDTLRLQDNLIDEEGGAHLGWMLIERRSTHTGVLLKEIRTDHNPVGQDRFNNKKKLIGLYERQCSISKY